MDYSHSTQYKDNQYITVFPKEHEKWMKFSYKYQAERKKENNCQSHWDDGTVKQLGERLAEFYSKLKEQTGGILIFFPSYPALDQCYVAWQTLFSTIGR